MEGGKISYDSAVGAHRATLQPDLSGPVQYLYLVLDRQLGVGIRAIVFVLVNEIRQTDTDRMVVGVSRRLFILCFQVFPNREMREPPHLQLRIHDKEIVIERQQVLLIHGVKQGQYITS